MPPRPFPLPLRVGVDICQIPRVKGLIGDKLNPDSKSWQRFIRRLLTARESRYFKAIYAGPRFYQDGNSDRAASFLAGRWAAKEACIKAVKPRKITPLEVEVWPENDKEIYAIILDKRAAETETDEAGEEPPAPSTTSPDGPKVAPNPYDYVPSHDEIEGQITRLSITHDGEYACAVALVASEPHPDDVGGEAAARRASGE